MQRHNQDNICCQWTFHCCITWWAVIDYPRSVCWYYTHGSYVKIINDILCPQHTDWRVNKWNTTAVTILTDEDVFIITVKHVHCLLTHCSNTDGHPECPLQTGSKHSSCSHQMTSSHLNKTVRKRLSNRNGTWVPSNRTENMATMTVPDTSRQLKFIIFPLKRGQFVFKGFKIEDVENLSRQQLCCQQRTTSRCVAQSSQSAESVGQWTNGVPPSWSQGQTVSAAVRPKIQRVLT